TSRKAGYSRFRIARSATASRGVFPARVRFAGESARVAAGCQEVPRVHKQQAPPSSGLQVIRQRSRDKHPDQGYIALLGWSLNAIDAMERFDRRYVVVAPPWATDYAREHDIPFIEWDFERLNERSLRIAETLKNEGVDVSVPLFEEAVEWAGAINSVLMG